MKGVETRGVESEERELRVVRRSEERREEALWHRSPDRVPDEMIPSGLNDGDVQQIRVVVRPPQSRDLAVEQDRADRQGHRSEDVPDATIHQAHFNLVECLARGSR